MSFKSWKITLSKILLLVFFITKIAFVGAQDQPPYVCLNNGNYTVNSTYSTNLNTLLSSLSSNIADNGFYNASVGRNTDTANALVLCRTDRTLDQCRTCVQNAAVGVLEVCPNRRQAVIWYEFCMLRYSNEPIFRTPTFDPGLILSNTADVSSSVVDQFRENRTRLVADLRVRAANGSSAVKGGAGSRNTSNSETLHMLVQCTPDLSSEDCNDCLNRAAQPIGSSSARGMRLLFPSCNIRYELYSFYNETRLREIQALLPPPLPPPPSPPAPAGTNNDTTGGNETNNDSTRGKKDDNTTKIVVSIVVPVVVCLIVAAFAVICVRKRMKRRARQRIPSDEDNGDISTVESLQHDFGKIRDATNDFDDANKLGQGGFGAVYMGRLRNGEEMAVKRLSKDSGQGNVEFKNEVLLLAKLQHRNLVRLLGFSIEGTERLLIYEYVENASLDQFIFDSVKRSILDWDKRYKIIGGIARGLVYLHEDSRLRIIHRDLKASNILLDGEMNPKIADFGMARLFGQDETQGNTSKIVGTYGYMSPEYAMHGHFSVKSDVFSFGVLVLEIMSGQKNNSIRNGDNVEDLLTFTWKNWREGTAENIIDPVLRTAGTGSLRDMIKCIHIGLLCVQENAANRPTMASILVMLSSSTMTLPVPSEPAFFMASRFGPNTLLFRNYDDSNSSDVTKGLKARTAMSEGSSVNDVTVTELDPR
ncbi:hypothetical protein ABFX02_13G119200 [Erythranthe guttata]